MRHVLVKKGGEVIPVQIEDGEAGAARVAKLQAEFGAEAVTEADGAPPPPPPNPKPKAAAKKKAKSKKRK